MTEHEPTPDDLARDLAGHMGECARHPMAAALRENDDLNARLASALERLAVQAALLAGREEDAAARPRRVCLCGSTRFKREFVEANFRETMAGRIVLSVGWFSHFDGHIYAPTEAEKAALDELHLRKIDLADEVLVLNVEGYVGDSTRREIAYALAAGKPVRYLEPPRGHGQGG